MRNWRTYFPPVAAAVGILFAAVFLYSRIVSPALTVYAQRVVLTSDLKPAPTPFVRERVVGEGQAGGVDNQTKPNLIVAPCFRFRLCERRQAENVSLQYSLRWAFGGKSQFGWFIYVPLIQQTTNAPYAVETPEFAGAIAIWQQQFGYCADGQTRRQDAI
jgi:hypothetical protein